MAAEMQNTCTQHMWRPCSIKVINVVLIVTERRSHKIPRLICQLQTLQQVYITASNYQHGHSVLVMVTESRKRNKDKIRRQVRRQVQWEWTVMDTIRQRKLQLFSHICRMLDDRPLKSFVLGMVEGERRPRRPVWRWIDDILMWCSKDVQEAMMMTVDRDNWRRFVASPYGTC